MVIIIVFIEYYNIYRLSQKVEVESSSFLLVFWKGSSEKQYMRLWFMDHIMNPAKALLNTKSSPLLFRHQMCFWNLFCQLFRQHDMPVLVLLVRVFVGVIDVFE